MIPSAIMITAWVREVWPDRPELIAIDGYYRTAEDMAADLRGRPVQVWLEGAGLMIAAME